MSILRVMSQGRVKQPVIAARGGHFGLRCGCEVGPMGTRALPERSL